MQSLLKRWNRYFFEPRTPFQWYLINIKAIWSKNIEYKANFLTDPLYILHKPLCSGDLDFEAQGRDSTFTFLHALLKKAILHW